MDDIYFDAWYDELRALAKQFGENVSDRGAWREEFDTGKSAEKSFYEEFPEHRQAMSAAIAQGEK